MIKKRSSKKIYTKSEENFFKNLEQITSKLSKVQGLNKTGIINIFDVYKDGQVNFDVIGSEDVHPKTEFFSTLESYFGDRNKVVISSELTNKENDFLLNNEDIEKLISLQKNNIPLIQLSYYLSKSEFKKYASYFSTKWDKINEKYMIEEIKETITDLIPQYELSFNTVLNVLNAHIEKNPHKPLPLSLETKISLIFESFEKKINEIKRKKKEIISSEYKELEEKLEEQLEFELVFITRRDEHKN
jgi:hypothetical protein